MKDFLSALGFLTVIPVNDTVHWDERGKLFYFPLVGILIGLFLLIIDSLAGLILNSIGTAAADLLFLIFISGGLHLDGLADSCDGLFSRREKNSILEIMKDSRSGVFGVVAVVAVMLAKWSGFLSLGTDRWIILVFAPALARSGMLISLYFMPYARKGDGIASGFLTETKNRRELALVLIPLFAPFIFNVWIGLALAVFFFITTIVWLSLCWRRIEGMTGDTTGALGEILETVLFFSACIM